MGSIDRTCDNRRWQAEEEAWARLPTDVSCCPEESEGGGASDIDEAATPVPTTAAAVATVEAAAADAADAAAREETTALLVAGQRSTECEVGGHDTDDGKVPAAVAAAATTEPTNRGNSDDRAVYGRSGERSGDDVGTRGDGDVGNGAETQLELEIKIPVEEEQEQEQEQGDVLDDDKGDVDVLDKHSPEAGESLCRASRMLGSAGEIDPVPSRLISPGGHRYLCRIIPRPLLFALLLPPPSLFLRPLPHSVQF